MGPMLTKQQFPSWHALLTEALHYGMANMQPEALDKWLADLTGSVRRSMLDPFDGPARLKPSSGISCQGQAALILAGHAVADEPNRVTYANGHFHHALCYAALESALPPDVVSLSLEEEFSLPDSLPWWPEKGTPGFSDRSFIDITLELLDDDWLARGLPRRLVADIKTKAGRSMSYAKPVHDVDKDVFGNSAQVALYSEMQGTLGAGALIISVNKEVSYLPAGRFGVSYIWPEDLQRVRDQVQARVEAAGRGEFVPELWLRRDEPNSSGRGKLFLPCNQVRGAEPGTTYCSVSAECEKRREGWEV